MNPKNLITIVLAAFIGVSVAVLVVKAVQKETPAPEAGASPTQAAAPDLAKALAAEPSKAQVVAYYFHGNTRCPTCQSIERYAQEAVALGFPTELNDGRIEWRVVNYDLPENEHFKKDYEMVAPSVVLARRGTQPFENLAEVWTLVQDKNAFTNYVQTQLRVFLAQKAAGDKQG
jgi:hypothetical protein